MTPRDIYAQKVKCQMEIAQKHMDTWRLSAKHEFAEHHTDYINQEGEYDLMFDAMRFKIKELVDASEETWEHLKEDIEKALAALTKTVIDATEKYRK